MNSELGQLLENEIPECRRNLQDSYTNLERVAAYCDENYMKVADKHRALEETKNYTTQSLASVAYQINMLATNFLRLLDLQMNHISDMESNINHLSQIVMIHKEKVARREIGELTANKPITRIQGVKNPGIIFPEQNERPTKYIRKPIDYSALDNLGHGVKMGTSGSQYASSTIMRNGSNTIGRSGLSSTSSNISAPSMRPPTPPTNPAQNYGSLRRPVAAAPTLSSPYKTPMVQPFSTQPPLGNYATGGYAAGMHQPSPSINTNMAPPLSGTGTLNRGVSGYAPGLIALQSQTLVPQTPQLQSQFSRTSNQYIAEPPGLNHYNSNKQHVGNISPPLPPPPQGAEEDHAFNLGYGHVGYNYANYDGRMSRQPQQADDWIPATYIEKVVAIYSYQQDKDDELSFEEGTVIYVVKKNDDGWWEGVMRGTTGLFPGNYVEPCI